MGSSEVRTKRGNRIYKLYKTSKHWTYRKKVKGRTHYFQLGPDTVVAKKMADDIDAFLYFNTLDDAIEEFQPNKAAFLNAPTIGELIKVFEANLKTLDIKSRTARDYSAAIKKIVKKGLNKKDADKILCRQNWNLVFNNYKLAMLKDLEEEDEIIARKRTCNSVLRNAKSLVSEEIENIYSTLNMDWVKEFRKLKGFKKVAVHYTLPPMKLIEVTHEYLANQKCNFKFVAVALALHGGLRRGEIAHICRSWFDLSGDEENAINIVPDKKFKPKGGTGGTALMSPYWAKRIYARADGIDYLLDINRNTSKTIDAAFDPIIADLREIGWTRNSPLHECRKLYGAHLASTTSLFKAQKVLRHTSPQITSDHYADLVVSDKINELWAA